jgi:hypothetical protein
LPVKLSTTREVLLDDPGNSAYYPAGMFSRCLPWRNVEEANEHTIGLNPDLAAGELDDETGLAEVLLVKK